MQRAPLLLVLPVLVAACESPHAVVEVPPVRFEAHAWSGGALLLTSDGFRGSATVRVLLADQSITAQRLDDSSLTVALPETTGTVALSVELDGVHGPTAQVTLHGLEHAHAIDAVDGFPLAWPYGRGTFVGSMGATGWERGRLYRIDPATGAATLFLRDSLFTVWCGSPSSGAGQVLIVGQVFDDRGNLACRVRALAMAAPWTVVDSMPGDLYTYSWYASYTRLAGGHWLWPVEHYVQLLRRDGASFTYAQDPYWGTARLVVSPDGEFAVPLGGFAFPPDVVPLFRADSLFSPLDLPNMSRSRSAAFTESGDTLFIQRGAVGDRRADSLFVVETHTGAILRSVPAVLAYDALAADIGRPWLYALTADTLAGGATLTIYDRRTMAVVAVQHARGHAVVGSLAWLPAFLAVDVYGRRLGAVLTYDWNPSAAYTLSFSLMP